MGERKTLRRFLSYYGSRFGLLLVVLALLAVVLEIGTRIFSDITPPLKDIHPVIGSRYRPGFSAKVFAEEAGRKIHMRFNKDGFRGPDWSRDNPPGLHRVALLGDSFIAALAVDEQDTAAAQLEKLLCESQHGMKWEVMNLGVSGASTGTELVTYREVASRYHPDIVLCAFFVENDLSDNSSSLDTKNRIYFELDQSGNPVQKPYYGFRKSSSKWLNIHSRFYVWQKIAIRKLTINVQEQVGSINNGSWIYCPDPPEKIAAAWDLTEKLIVMFRNEVVRNGSRFVLVVIPSSLQIYDNRFAALRKQAEDFCPFDPDNPDRRIKRICEEHDIPLVLMKPAFRAATPSHSSDKPDEWLFFFGSGHLNERGNRLAAEEIHRFLAGSPL